MFVKSIEKVNKFTRPIHTISREYDSDEVIPGAATLFFVNEFGHAITCRHVAQHVFQANAVNSQYNKFKAEKQKLSSSGKYKRKLKELETKYRYKEGLTIQLKNSFVNCADFKNISYISHPKYDLAILKFEDFTKLGYEGHATFLKDSSTVKQGKALCRLGYPFPEFSNFKYNSGNDDIEWTQDGIQGTPVFPIDGIVTRLMLDKDTVAGIELSTPGLRGQSGGPLFDESGLIYGMQSKTHHLHLGFDIKDKEINFGSKKKKVSNYPFLNLGACVHVDIIKDFLKENGIKYYESDNLDSLRSIISRLLHKFSS